MSGTQGGRRIQLAKEVTAGTKVAIATVVLRSLGVAEDQSPIVIPDENIGNLGPSNRTYKPYEAAQIKLDSSECTFEQLPYIFAMAIKNVVAGVADGPGSGYIYSYEVPHRAPNANVLQTYSVQAGDEEECELGTYLFCTEFHLGGKGKESWKRDASLQSRRIERNYLAGSAGAITFDATAGNHINDSGNGLAVFPVGAKVVVAGTTSNNGTYTVTNSAAGILTVTETITPETPAGVVTLRETFSEPSEPTVEEILFNMSKLYIDDVADGIGVTQKSDTLLGCDVRVTTGWYALHAGNGQLYFAKAVHAGVPVQKVEFDITFEHDGSATSEKAKQRAQTTRLIRIQANSPTALATAGTKYSTKAMRMDFAGKWSKFTPLGAQDGNNVVTGTFVPAYNSTADLYALFEVCNELATLP